ncbi:MAG: carbohydrate ABC transporter permease, partial [Thermomicrobiales bacterium]|nr:carbohydrate ABC transporter permease [Thermomicrobiales bacterium]
AFARFRLRGGKAILLGILATQMFPAILLAIPLYILIRNLGLLNSLVGLVLVYTTFALPFCVWMMRNYFLSIPRDLDESAMVDGATRLQALWSVVLPVAMPGIAATGIFSFILSWNEFLYANTFISSADLRTLPVGLQSLIGEFTTDWGLLMAGAVITTMPIVIIFFFVQRKLTQGLASGAVKG